MQAKIYGVKEKYMKKSKWLAGLLAAYDVVDKN